jgi:DNA primase
VQASCGETARSADPPRFTCDRQQGTFHCFPGGEGRDAATFTNKIADRGRC